MDLIMINLDLDRPLTDLCKKPVIGDKVANREFPKQLPKKPKSYLNTYNNEYLMIVLFLIIIASDLLLFQSIFGKFSLILKIIFFYGSSLMFLLLIIQ
jgi:hypothetical protein